MIFHNGKYFRILVIVFSAILELQILVLEESIAKLED